MLDLLRALIRKVAPKITEQIGGGMLDYPGLGNLAAQKNYVSLYVAPSVLASRRDDFPGVSCGKSCLRFRRLDQLNRAALSRLLREVHEFQRRERLLRPALNPGVQEEREPTPVDRKRHPGPLPAPQRAIVLPQ